MKITYEKYKMRNILRYHNSVCTLTGVHVDSFETCNDNPNPACLSRLTKVQQIYFICREPNHIIILCLLVWHEPVKMNQYGRIAH